MKKSQKPRKKASHPELSAINPNAAGIDIGADRHWVSVPEGRDRGYGINGGLLVASVSGTRKPWF